MLLRTTLLLLALAAALPLAAEDKAKPKDDAHWSSLITVADLHERLSHDNLLIIDARSPEEYAAGHIPGAINLPGHQWRTPATQNPATQGVGSQIFRTKAGKLDVARYETFLSKAGVKPEHEVVVYGNHAGKADGSVPAAILLKLGHSSVAFVDGVGLDDWKAAGYEISKQAHKLPASQYKAAHAQPERLWSRADVLKHLKDEDVVIIDSRTPQEYAGEDLRGNQRGGHIPGAKLLDAAEFLSKSKATISPEEAKKKIEALGISKDKTVVIYCQSGTRCSHKELILKDLGFENVVLYDASWQDWGNREDTPIEAPAKP